VTKKLRYKIFIGVAVTGVGLLLLTAVPSLANLEEEIKDNSSSNFTRCWQTLNQDSQTNFQWMAQYGPMMSTGRNQIGGWGHHSRYGQMYNPNSIETISGEVINIDTFAPMGGMSQGMHLRLKTDKGNVDVHLGPTWYLENQDIQIQPSDKIMVTGSRVNFSGQSVMMATKVSKGNQTLILRDENGFPVWHGWRQQQTN
jgi:hypothetical protein